MFFQNKKLRQQVEETEQTLYARRTRYNEQMNAALNGSPSDDSQSKRIMNILMHSIILMCTYCRRFNETNYGVEIEVTRVRT